MNRSHYHSHETLTILYLSGRGQGEMLDIYPYLIPDRFTIFQIPCRMDSPSVHNITNYKWYYNYTAFALFPL